MEENKILKKFEATDVTIEVIDGKPMFELDSVGIALGYSRTVTTKGKKYFHIRKDRIESILKNADITPFSHGGKTLLTVNQVYDFMLEAHTAKCKPFRKWITDEVLPQIESTGAYIETGREEEMVAKYFPSFSQETQMDMVNDLLKQNKEYKEQLKVLVETEGLTPMNIVAKECNIGLKRLYKFLRNNSVVFYKDGINIPYQRFMDQRLFAVKEVICKDGRTHSTTFATKKGLLYIQKLLKKKGYYEAIAE